MFNVNKNSKYVQRNISDKGNSLFKNFASKNLRSKANSRKLAMKLICVNKLQSPNKTYDFF